MEIADPPIRNTEARIVSGKRRVWGNERDDGKDKLIWELENCKIGSVIIQSKELMRESVLRLVWGAGDRLMAGGRCCFLPRPDASLVKKAEVFSM